MRIMWFDNGSCRQLFIQFGDYQVVWPDGKPMTQSNYANIMQVYDSYLMLNSGLTAPGNYGTGGKRTVWIVPDNIAEMIFDILGLKYSKS